MTPADKLKLAQLNTVAKALKDAAADAWAKGYLADAGKLFLRADIAESRAHYFELNWIVSESEKAILADLWRGGRPML